MKIEKNLPFESCDTCCECILDVDEQILFSHGESCQRIVRVGCKNASLCLKLKQKMEEEHEQST